MKLLNHFPDLITIRRGKREWVSPAWVQTSDTVPVPNDTEAAMGDVVTGPELRGEEYVVKKVDRNTGVPRLAHTILRIVSRAEWEAKQRPRVAHVTFNNQGPVGAQVAGDNHAPITVSQVVTVSQALGMLADQVERDTTIPEAERTTFVQKLRQLAAEGLKVGGSTVVAEVVKNLVALGMGAAAGAAAVMAK